MELRMNVKIEISEQSSLSNNDMVSLELTSSNDISHIKLSIAYCFPIKVYCYFRQAEKPWEIV